MGFAPAIAACTCGGWGFLLEFGTMARRRNRLGNKALVKVGRKGKRKNVKVTGYFDRARILREMGFASYTDYLASNLWKGIRGKMLAEHPVCGCCNSDPATCVHHHNYDRGTLKGLVTHELVTLCDACHKAIEFDRGVKRVNMMAIYTEFQKLRSFYRSL
jgi:hypothetical protein